MLRPLPEKTNITLTIKKKKKKRLKKSWGFSHSTQGAMTVSVIFFF